MRALPGKPGSNWQLVPATSAWIPSADAQVTHFYNYVQDCNRAGKIATVRAYMRKISCALKAAEIKDMVKQMCEAGLLELDVDRGLHILNPDGKRSFFAGSDTALTTTGVLNQRGVWSC